MTIKEFIESILPGAMESYKRWGILPSVTISQAILESSDKNGTPGGSQLASQYNNYFGIKGKGSAGSVSLPTKEYENGKWVSKDANFKIYNNPNESILDHGELIGTANRYSGVRSATDYKSQTFALQTAKYATDPNYSGKLNSIIAQNRLYQYDTNAGAWESGSGNSFTPGKDQEGNPLPDFNINFQTIGSSFAIIVGVMIGVIGLYLLVTE